MKIPGMKQLCGIWKKLSGRRGTTLGEMLVAVLILLMLTMVVAGGTGIAVKVYRSEKAYSESRVLANTVLLAMTEELRYASGLTVGEDGTSVSYDSRSYGAGTTMNLESQGVGEGGLIKLTYSGEGEHAAPRTNDLFQESTYSSYRIQPHGEEPLFSLDGETLVISYDVCDPFGKVQAELEGVRIRLLNTGTK